VTVVLIVAAVVAGTWVLAWALARAAREEEK
jgi:hypothetical protein